MVDHNPFNVDAYVSTRFKSENNSVDPVRIESLTARKKREEAAVAA